ncbi:hypothetical protein VF21_06203 [Pseudogymnoascus sp. 05NY08]|nr:hypothetical protein VF21_06203 [Pseudogymnoascus sp. 05NY08]
MAPELKSKKRKAAANDDEVEVAKKEKKVTVDTPAKKRKTAEHGTPEVKKTKATKAAAAADAPPAVESPKVEKPTMKATKAAAAPVVAEATEEKKGKKTKAPAAAPVVAEAATEEKKGKKSKAADKPLSENRKKLKEMKDAPDAEANALKAKKAKASKAASAPAVEEAAEVEAEVAAQEDSDIEMDDQTAALLQGFESGSEDEAVADEPGYAGEPIPELSKKAKNKLAKLAAQKSVSAGPGTVYLGRIPHGFYENEMRMYFKQFGDITQLRLSRNRKTGNSKHYAFIQFASADVAEIVSKTMDSYLLFKHILKCKVVPEEQVHAAMWEGANKRFKKVPWNKMEGRKLNAGLDEAGWEKRNATETKRREEKKEKLKAIGYEFEAPALKSAKGVPKTPRQKVVVDVEPEVEAAEAEKEVVEEPKPVEVVKAAEPVKESKRKADATETEEPSKKKQKKVKAKASTDNLKAAAATPAAVEKPAVVEKATRPKRAVAEKKVVEEPAAVAAAKPAKAKKAAAAPAVVEEKVEKAEKPAKRAKKSKA